METDSPPKKEIRNKLKIQKRTNISHCDIKDNKNNPPYPPFPHSGGFAEAKVKEGKGGFEMSFPKQKLKFLGLLYFEFLILNFAFLDLYVV
jgi:hypothetical protein